MREFLDVSAHYSVTLLELAGIAAIVLVAVIATLRSGLGLVRGEDRAELYEAYRRRIGRGILLGLEFLVAADIIETVTVELSVSTVLVLAVIVLIRTFLSFTIEVELTGRWPWQQKASEPRG